VLAESLKSRNINALRAIDSRLMKKALHRRVLKI